MKQEFQYAIEVELRLFDDRILYSINLICQYCCASLFDDKFDSGRIL